MKTIEERARECVRDMWDAPWYAWDASAFSDFMNGTLLFVHGALTEQKAIDIDKACEWLRARNVLTKDSLEGFRKAMEEE